MLKSNVNPADDNDDEQTNTLNYNHTDVTKGGLSNTISDVHVNLPNVVFDHNGAPSDNLIAVTNNPNNPNTSATRIPKTNENTYGRYISQVDLFMMIVMIIHIQ